MVINKINLIQKELMNPSEFLDNRKCLILDSYNAYLLGEKTKQQRVAAYPELGMEALHLLEIDEFPIIIAAAGGRSIYE